MRFEVLTTTLVKNSVFREMMPCGLVYFRCFEGAFCFHLQGIYMEYHLKRLEISDLHSFLI